MRHTQISEIGFVSATSSQNTSEGAPICRWQHGLVKLDLMPSDERHPQIGLCHHSKLSGSRNVTADSATNACSEGFRRESERAA